MAVSTLLNDLALAATTDRNTASKKSQSKKTDRDFGSALSESRKEHASKHRTDQLSAAPRPHPRHEPKVDQSRDHHNDVKSEADRPKSQQGDIHHSHESRHRDAKNGKSDATTETEVKNDASAPEKSSTESTAKESQQPADEDKTAATETKPVETATLVQPAVALPTIAVETPALQAELQTAALLSGSKTAVQPSNSDLAETEGKGVIEIDVTGQTKVANAAAILAKESTKTEASAEKATEIEGAPIQLNAQELAATKASGLGAKVTEKATEIQTATSSLDPLATQSPQSKTNLENSLADRLAINAAAIENAKSAQADKPVAGINAITATGPTVTAESTQILKASATPSEAMARADAPVPMQAVAVEIGMRAMRGSKEFSIRLDPEDLGRIDIKLEISEAGEVQAKLVVERVETLHLLQRDAKTLERAFDQAGLKSNPDGLQFSLKDPGHQRDGQQNQRSDRAATGGFDPDKLTIEDTSIRTFRYSSPATSGLDIRI